MDTSTPTATPPQDVNSTSPLGASSPADNVESSPDPAAPNSSATANSSAAALDSSAAPHLPSYHDAVATGTTEGAPGGGGEQDEEKEQAAVFTDLKKIVFNTMCIPHPAKQYQNIGKSPGE